MKTSSFIRGAPAHPEANPVETMSSGSLYRGARELGRAGLPWAREDARLVGIWSGPEAALTGRAANSAVRVPSSHGGSHWFESNAAHCKSISDKDLRSIDFVTSSASPCDNLYDNPVGWPVGSGQTPLPPSGATSRFETLRPTHLATALSTPYDRPRMELTVPGLRGRGRVCPPHRGNPLAHDGRSSFVSFHPGYA